MPDVTLIELGFGKANLSNTFATYANMLVTPPFKRISAIAAGKRGGGGGADQVGTHQDNGVIVRNRVEHAWGSIILLQVAWKRGGVPIKDGAIFIRLRQGAPLYRILGILPMGRDNLLGRTFVMFSGYGDIMNEEDLTMANLQVNRSYTQKFMSEEELEECFEITQLAPATQERPSVTAVATPEGIQLRELGAIPARRFRIRGGA
jgi:hypothetical protein